MKLLSSLIALASIALAVSLALLVTGVISLPVFLAVAMSGFLLFSVRAYAPRRELRLPVKAVAFTASARSCCT